MRGIGECKDKRGRAGLNGDRERSRQLREDIMLFQGTSVIEEGMRGVVGKREWLCVASVQTRW